MPYIGLKAHFKNIPLADILEMFLFEGAYMGISPIGNNCCNVACLCTHALFETHVQRIEEGRVIVSNHKGESTLPADQVFALTGYHPDFQFLRSMGIMLDPQTNKPVMDPQSHESNVPGIFVAGVVTGGNHTSEIFIENGRFHGKQIVAALTGSRIDSPAKV